MFNFDDYDGLYADDNYDWSSWDAAADDYVNNYFEDFMGPPASAAGGMSQGQIDSWLENWEADKAAQDDYWKKWEASQTPQDIGEAIRMLTGGSGNLLSNLGRISGAGAERLKSAIINPQSGDVNWKNIAGIAGALYGANQGNQPQKPTGYQGSIPQYEATRAAVPGTQDAERRPGSGGQRYFTDVQYAAPGNAGAQEAAQTQAAQLATQNIANPMREVRPANSGYAAGGIATLAKGGAPRYLNGATDGMADKIPANIDGKQEARLSHGEFVVPADVVGHLGNGNSEAGAQRLYTMMDKIRQARTGTTKQGTQINPDKYLPK
jgi:hypothetical protein